MAISVGDRIPEVDVTVMGDDGPTTINTKDIFSGKKVVLFAVPAAFSPTCSDEHLPGYISHAEEIRNKGVDTIACLAVNDPFVMQAWAEAKNIDGKIMMLSDGEGEFTKAVEKEFELPLPGFRPRSVRYAMIVEDGEVKYLADEGGPGIEVSTAEKVLEQL